MNQENLLNEIIADDKDRLHSKSLVNADILLKKSNSNNILDFNMVSSFIFIWFFKNRIRILVSWAKEIKKLFLRKKGKKILFQTLFNLIMLGLEQFSKIAWNKMIWFNMVNLKKANLVYNLKMKMILDSNLFQFTLLKSKVFQNLREKVIKMKVIC